MKATQDLIETVARTMYERDWDTGFGPSTWEDLGETTRYSYRNLAAAALDVIPDQPEPVGAAYLDDDELILSALYGETYVGEVHLIPIPEEA